MLLTVILLVAGLLLLIKGADFLVNGASAVAKRYNVPDLVIGLTVVAFGTSAPEFVVSLLAVYRDHQEIVLGNVIGSNLFNLFAILGIVGLFRPIAVQSSTVWKEIPISLFAAILLLVLANNFGGGANVLSRLDGLILLIFFGGFVYYISRNLRSAESELTVTDSAMSIAKGWMYVVIGLGALVVGGNLLVTNAVKIAITVGISEKIVGLTIVAAGTSFPELATSIVAAMKKNSDIAMGNIIGSNIFNILFVLSASCLAGPIKYDTGYNLELLILIVGTVFLFVAMFTGGKKKLDRPEAGLLLAAYIGYMFYLIYN